MEGGDEEEYWGSFIGTFDKQPKLNQRRKTIIFKNGKQNDI